MKTARLLLITLFLPLVFHGQHSLTGLWTGVLTNDSTTARVDQSFEIALTQYKQKVYGYSRSTFLVHDTLFYILKRVKGTIDNNVCEVTDDDIISSNFPGRIDKGVKVTMVFHLNQQDTTWSLDGSWKTNVVKRKFYGLSGKANLQEEKNLDNSKIFSHLEELKLADDVAFYKESKTQPPPQKIIQTVAVPQKQITPVKQDVAIVTEEKKPEPKKEKPSKKQKEPEPVASSSVDEKIVKKNEVTAPPTIKPDNPVITPPAIVTSVAAKEVAIRKTVAPQIVNFKSDSLELAIYDNGEVDGDTVSVLLNGEVILARQGLKTTAIKKTIYIVPGQEEFTLVLYAENLGKYPPNTGLLVVHDGDESYQLKFTADLQQNAGVIFRRKTKP